MTESRGTESRGSCAAILLAGGRARRMAGADKLLAAIGPHTVLDRTLAALPGLPVVAVGPPRPTAVPVRWTREEPPGGGPVAAIAAGLAALDHPAETVVLLAADQPGVDAGTIDRLRAALAGSIRAEQGEPPAGAVLCDAGGRRQWLASVWRRTALRAELPADPTGVAVYAVLAGLPVVDVPAVAAEARDVDTPDDLDWWRRRLDHRAP